MKMNSAEFEIWKAIKEAQRGPAVIKQICLLCKDCLPDWDLRRGFATCWRCREFYCPAPKIEEEKAEPKATLLRLKDGRYVILLDQPRSF
jgi:hypothetical protein